MSSALFFELRSERFSDAGGESSRRAVQEPFRAVGMESGAEEVSAWAEPCESASGGTVQVLTLRGLAAGAGSCGATLGSTLRALFLRVLAIVVWKNLKSSTNYWFAPSPWDRTAVAIYNGFVASSSFDERRFLFWS
jgi:hypothetical protein